tara:strand:+ start:1841 stop:2215 length:375 start_codon:yes stop_codon:yes gene_type:complete
MTDRLTELFEMRERFMHALRAKIEEAHPAWPLDLGEKKSQQFCRDMAVRGVEEVFEAVQLLKNWKPHRQTEVPEFDREKFLEEMVDSFNYFFSLIILAGFTADEFYEMYHKKDKIIHERLKTGY